MEEVNGRNVRASPRPVLWIAIDRILSLQVHEQASLRYPLSRGCSRFGTPKRELEFVDESNFSRRGA